MAGCWIAGSIMYCIKREKAYICSYATPCLMRKWMILPGIGGIIAGMAFILPGVVLMLITSYLYSLDGFENKYFNASFCALQPVLAAMVSNRRSSE